MDEIIETSGVASYITNDVLVVPIQVELHDDVLALLEKEILNKLSHHHLQGVLLDVSSVNIIDRKNIEFIDNMMKTFKLMGAKSVLTGIRPSIALALINLGYDPKYIRTAMNLERGFDDLQQQELSNSDDMLSDGADQSYE